MASAFSLSSCGRPGRADGAGVRLGVRIEPVSLFFILEKQPVGLQLDVRSLYKRVEILWSLEPQANFIVSYDLQGP